MKDARPTKLPRGEWGATVDGAEKYAETMGPLAVPLPLLSWWNPLLHPCWGPEVVTRDSVEEALKEGRVRQTPWDPKRSFTKTLHAERIAYFTLQRDTVPIQIDVGIPSLGHYPSHLITDGNHRLGAAFYRGDGTILAEFSGEVKAIEALLRGEYDEYKG